jgi:hypothetical protein
MPEFLSTSSETYRLQCRAVWEGTRRVRHAVVRPHAFTEHRAKFSHRSQLTQIYGSIGQGHRGFLCQLQYGYHASVFPSWWAVVSGQDRVNDTSGDDCFTERMRPHNEISAYHVMKSTETRLCCEMSCFQCDFDYGLILGYEALFIDKRLPEVSEKLAALDS